MKRYRVKPGSRVELSKWNPDDSSAFKGSEKKEVKRVAELKEKLDELQQLLYAERKHKLLIVLQGMDTSGKDGTIRHIFDGVSPQGIRVASFKAPSPEELDHDYLWRVHRHVPGKGEIVIFNRSHYEDVLAVRVLKLAPKEVWSRRFEHLNSFERMLTDEGVRILKFYLNISQKEQKKRLQDRLDQPDKHWKISPSDFETRKLWPGYTKAFEDAMGKTSTDYAPWYIVPANQKSYRNLVISTILVETLKGLKMRYPEPELNAEEIRLK